MLDFRRRNRNRWRSQACSLPGNALSVEFLGRTVIQKRHILVGTVEALAIATFDSGWTTDLRFGFAKKFHFARRTF